MNIATAVEPEIVRVGQLEMRFYTNGGSESDATVFEFTVPGKGFVPPPHFHVTADELVITLEGELTYTVDGQRHVLRKGQSAFCPHGSVHQFLNEGTEPVRVLTVLTPGTIGIDFFREAAAVVNAGGPPDPVKMKDVMLRHGLVPA